MDKQKPLNEIRKERQMAYEWTQIGYWKKPNLSWTIYLMLVVGLGFFGIDHLYMRSPFTAFLKFILNILTLGFWYLYDVIGAFTEADVIKKYGVTTPFVPTGGIGAGMFSDKPDVKHGPWKFMGYSLTSGFPFGLFGLNNLIIGDTKGAMIKFWMTAMFAFPLIFFFPLTWVIAICAALYGIGVLFFKTETIFSKGAPSIFGRVATDMGPDGAMEVDGTGFFGGIFKSIFRILGGLPIVGPMVQQAQQQVDMAIAGAQAVKASTYDVAMAGADAVKTLAVDVPGEAVKAVGMINDGIQQKIKELPSPTSALRKDLFGLPDLPAGPPGLSGIPGKSSLSIMREGMFGLPDLPDLPKQPSDVIAKGKKSLKERLFGLPNLNDISTLQSQVKKPFIPVSDFPSGQPPMGFAPPMQAPMASAPPVSMRQLPVASAPPAQTSINVINPLEAATSAVRTGTLVGGGSSSSIASMALMGVLYGGLVLVIGNLLYRQYKKVQEEKEGLEVEDKKTGSRHQSELSDVPPKA